MTPTPVVSMMRRKITRQSQLGISVVWPRPPQTPPRILSDADRLYFLSQFMCIFGIC